MKKLIWAIAFTIAALFASAAPALASNAETLACMKDTMHANGETLATARHMTPGLVVVASREIGLDHNIWRTCAGHLPLWRAYAAQRASSGHAERALASANAGLQNRLAAAQAKNHRLSAKIAALNATLSGLNHEHADDRKVISELENPAGYWYWGAGFILILAILAAVLGFAWSQLHALREVHQKAAADLAQQKTRLEKAEAEARRARELEQAQRKKDAELGAARVQIASLDRTTDFYKARMRKLEQALEDLLPFVSLTGIECEINPGALVEAERNLPPDARRFLIGITGISLENGRPRAHAAFPAVQVGEKKEPVKMLYEPERLVRFMRQKGYGEALLRSLGMTLDPQQGLDNPKKADFFTKPLPTLDDAIRNARELLGKEPMDCSFTEATTQCNDLHGAPRFH